jgi:hypothetical protein
MSFRERFLWTALLALIGPYLWYFGSVGISILGGASAESITISALVSALFVGLVIGVVAVIVLALLTRKEGTMRPDERERGIESRGFVISYHMLCTGVVLTIGAAWLGLSLAIVIHVLAFVFILAEMNRLVVEIHGLRRGY